MKGSLCNPMKKWNLCLKTKVAIRKDVKMKTIKSFDLTGKTVFFNFHRHTCHEVAFGKCAFMIEKIPQDLSHKETDKSNLRHCLLVKELMERELKGTQKKLLPVSLWLHKCGHYGTGQGQHRICISGTQKIKIPVKLGIDRESICSYCKDPENHLIKTF